MRRIIIVLLVLCLCLSTAPALAQVGVERDKGVMQQLVAVCTEVGPSALFTTGGDKPMSELRGAHGSSRKFGYYLDGKDIQYSSGYETVGPQRMSEFSYDLLQQWRRWGIGPELVKTGNWNGDVPKYAQLRQFALDWWNKNPPPGKPVTEQFMQDALLDGTLLVSELGIRTSLGTDKDKLRDWRNKMLTVIIAKSP